MKFDIFFIYVWIVWYFFIIVKIMWDKFGNIGNCLRRNLRCLNIVGVFNLFVNV